LDLSACAPLPRSCRRRPNTHPTDRPKNRRLLASELVPATLTVDPREVICAYSFDEVSKHFRVEETDPVRVSTAFKRLLNLPGVTVTDVARYDRRPVASQWRHYFRRSSTGVDRIAAAVRPPHPHHHDSRST